MLIIETNYSKKIGLPGYSSHQYSLTLRSEISDLNQVAQESQRLYALMQSCVDRELQQTGFLPGEPMPAKNGNGNGHNGNGNGHSRAIRPTEEPWKCSVKQKELILKIIGEHHLDKNGIEQLSQDRFGKGVRELNKLEASGLIEELIEKNPSKNGRATTPTK